LRRSVRAHIPAEEVDIVLDRRLMRRLGLVERALAKIGEETYGLCDATGERIPRGRLEAVPEAVYTIEAQRALEREA
jgi:DnaK suppressor protein